MDNIIKRYFDRDGASFDGIYSRLIFIAFFEFFVLSVLYLILIYGFSREVILPVLLSFVLFLETVEDLLVQKIRLGWIWFLLAIASLDMMIFYKPSKLDNMLWGLGLGLVLWLIAMLTREGFGKGDAMVVSLICICLGIKYSFTIFVLSLLLLSLFGIVKIIAFGASKKDKLAMLPFVYLSFLVLLAFVAV